MCQKDTNKKTFAAWCKRVTVATTTICAWKQWEAQHTAYMPESQCPTSMFNRRRSKMKIVGRIWLGINRGAENIRHRISSDVKHLSFRLWLPSIYCCSARKPTKNNDVCGVYCSNNIHAALYEGLLCENEAPNSNLPPPNNERRVSEHFFLYSDFSLLNTTNFWWYPKRTEISYIFNNNSDINWVYIVNSHV